MDTQLQGQKTLPKIKLSLLSLNFLQQKDSRVLLKYVEELYQSARLQNKEYQDISSLLQNSKNKINALNINNQFLKEELNKAAEINKTKKNFKPPNVDSKELLLLKKAKEEQGLKHKTYIIKFKNKVRKLFQNYAKQNLDQLNKLKYIQSSSQEIQRLIKVAQNNNQKLNKENQKLHQESHNLGQDNHKLSQANKENTETLSQSKKEILFLKNIQTGFLAQQHSVKAKAITALKALENEMKKSKIESEQNKKIIQIKDTYINKIQTPLKESKKELLKLGKENSELNIQSKMQAKNQNNLIIKLRQYQDTQEKLEQQKQALQKLNQNISLSLNQCRQQIQQMKNTNEKKFSPPPPHTEPLNVDKKKPISKVLAKLYSSYNK